jgi:25S rRNA (uracil2634-N3)-methyltransferase
MAPKYKKAKLKSALIKLQDNHQKRQRATDIQARKEAALEASKKQQQQPQQHQKSTAATKTNKKALSNLPPPPYNEHDTILLVGEANFSFAKCLALEVLNRGDTITATTLDSCTKMTEKYEDAQQNIKDLEEAGATVLFEVDATKLNKIKSLKGKRFSKIVFNFPHAGKEPCSHQSACSSVDHFSYVPKIDAGPLR